MAAACPSWSARRLRRDRDQGVAFVLDLTERKEASRPARERAAIPRSASGTCSRYPHQTLGELAASISHEVNQPLAGVVANAEAGLRWLGGGVPQLDKARRSVERIIHDGDRASEVIRRVRARAKRATPRPRRSTSMISSRNHRPGAA